MPVSPLAGRRAPRRGAAAPRGTRRPPRSPEPRRRPPAGAPYSRCTARRRRRWRRRRRRRRPAGPRPEPGGRRVAARVPAGPASSAPQSRAQGAPRSARHLCRPRAVVRCSSGRGAARGGVRGCVGGNTPGSEPPSTRGCNQLRGEGPVCTGEDPRGTRPSRQRGWRALTRSGPTLPSSPHLHASRSTLAAQLPPAASATAADDRAAAAAALAGRGHVTRPAGSLRAGGRTGARARAEVSAARTDRDWALHCEGV